MLDPMLQRLNALEAPLTQIAIAIAVAASLWEVGAAMTQRTLNLPRLGFDNLIKYAAIGGIIVVLIRALLQG
jgi:hypothetical protein